MNLFQKVYNSLLCFISSLKWLVNLHVQVSRKSILIVYMYKKVMAVSNGMAVYLDRKTAMPEGRNEERSVMR